MQDTKPQQIIVKAPSHSNSSHANVCRLLGRPDELGRTCSAQHCASRQRHRNGAATPAHVQWLFGSAALAQQCAAHRSARQLATPQLASITSRPRGRRGLREDDEAQLGARFACKPWASSSLARRIILLVLFTFLRHMGKLVKNHPKKVRI